MIVYDVVVDGKIVETVRPANQRPKEMYWQMVDHLHFLKAKYGNDVLLVRKFVYSGDQDAC